MRAAGVRAFLCDVGGTLLSPAEPVAHTYARVARAWGLPAEEAEIARRFRGVFRDLDEQQLGDGRAYWLAVVQGALGLPVEQDIQAPFEALYDHYRCPDAWAVAPGARNTLTRLRAHGLKLAVVSNFDARLRPLLQRLQLSALFDDAVISAELGLEKPDPALFLVACARLGVRPREAVHLGDSRRSDVEAARAAGCGALHWGQDLGSFAELERRLLG